MCAIAAQCALRLLHDGVINVLLFCEAQINCY